MLLDHDEQDRWSALRRPVDRNRFLVGCGLTRLALAGYLGRSPTEIAIARACPQCGRPHGKPRLTPALSSSRLEFSISHAGDRVVVAFAYGTPLGVDVEQVQPAFPVDKLVPEVLNPPEAEMLRDLDDEDRTFGFFVYWTRKEAVLKATGRGLALPLQRLTVSGPGERAQVTAWAEGPECARSVSLHDLDPGPGHVASLAVIGECRRVLIRDGSALIARWSATA